MLHPRAQDPSGVPVSSPPRWLGPQPPVTSRQPNGEGGVVAREECSENGRGLMVRLTDAGRRVIEEAAPARAETVHRCFFDLMSKRAGDARCSVRPGARQAQPRQGVSAMARVSNPDRVGRLYNHDDPRRAVIAVVIEPRGIGRESRDPGSLGRSAERAYRRDRARMGAHAGARHQ